MRVLGALEARRYAGAPCWATEVHPWCLHMQVACPLVTVIAEQVLRNEVLYMHACQHTAITRPQALMSDHRASYYELVEEMSLLPKDFL